MAAGVPARLSAPPPYTAKAGRRFGLTVGAAFLALAGLFYWRGRLTVAVVLGATGAALVLAAVLLPARLGPVERQWMRLAHAISRVTTPIFMGVLYFLLFLPFGAVRRALRRSPILRPRGAPSDWVSRTDGGRSNLQRHF